jgi:hypothetical protein
MRILSLAAIPVLTFVLPFCLGASESACRQASSSPSVVDSMVVDHYVFDPALRRSWAVMINCRHPGWPAQAVEIQSARLGVERARTSPAAITTQIAVPQVAVPAIKFGSRVELWRDGAAHIRLSGIALESAIVGQPIRVRAGLGSNPLRGIVRGPHSVELTDDSRTGWREP